MRQLLLLRLQLESQEIPTLSFSLLLSCFSFYSFQNASPQCEHPVREGSIPEGNIHAPPCLVSELFKQSTPENENFSRNPTLREAETLVLDRGVAPPWR